MQDEQHIIDTLGIAAWSEDKREPAVIEATMRIGNALMDDLSEAQYNEYTAIVDNNQDVITAWLEKNVPDYKENPVYVSIEADYDTDPEKNDPAKIFASLAWIQLNVPDLESRIAKTLEAYKQELSS
ncbi:MAG: DUF5663 domain-containing protein [Candidatus Microsaccharimonas sp.]